MHLLHVVGSLHLLRLQMLAVANHFMLTVVFIGAGYDSEYYKSVEDVC